MPHSKNIPLGAPKKRGRPVKVTCRALILLDTAKIRKEYLKLYKRRQKVLEKLEYDLRCFDDTDEPEFRKFMARHCGAEQTRLRELSEQIHLMQMRYEKIHFLARERGMSQKRYCAVLSERITVESDFWSVLEADLEALQEERQREEEELHKQWQAFPQEEFDDEDEMEEFEEADDLNDLMDELNGFFEQMFGGDDGVDTDEDEVVPENAPRENQLKKLYRELCFKYHPDKIGAHDVKMQHLWVSIQAAYQAGDLARLRNIHAGMELKMDKCELGCSEIDEMIGDVEWSITQVRMELRERKRAPFWGFSTWGESKRRQAERQIKSEMTHQIGLMERQLQQWETELQRLYSAKSKPKKRTKRELFREAMAQEPDLFSNE